MKKIILAAATTAIMTTAAVAEDKNFDGAYGGLEIGYNSLDFTDTIGGDGFTYGGLLGYRRQTNDNLVYGLEGRVGESTSSYEGVGGELHAGRYLGVDAIVGTTFDENLLAFALVGYSNLRVSDGVDAVNGDGIRFGLGGEYATGNDINLRVTGAYTDYEGDVDNFELLFGAVYNF